MPNRVGFAGGGERRPGGGQGRSSFLFRARVRSRAMHTQREFDSLTAAERRFVEPVAKKRHEKPWHQLDTFATDGEKRLFDVVRHPQCDRATALLVYWLSEPGEHTQYPKPADAPKSQRKMVELLREIEKKMSRPR